MTASLPYVAIACGGTGGHLFPGLAIAGELQRRGLEIALLVSPKQVDQDAVRGLQGMEVITLPAVALQNRNVFRFLHGAVLSYRLSLRNFRKRPPAAVLAMGGFTSAPPVLAGRKVGAATFLHEANAIPGRANRWLASGVNQAFVMFAGARARLSARETVTTGMPVRDAFTVADASSCRCALGLNPNEPVLLITGGSQGATAVNDLLVRALPLLQRRIPNLQFIHLTGTLDHEKIRFLHRQAGTRGLILPFLSEMELALGAATVAVSRAGASSIAELAAMRVPSILIPYPSAADNHQLFNAREVVAAGGAELLEQRGATPEALADLVSKLMLDGTLLETMRTQLTRWFIPDAAETVARQLMQSAGIFLPTQDEETTSPDISKPTRAANSVERRFPTGFALADVPAAWKAALRLNDFEIAGPGRAAKPRVRRGTTADSSDGATPE